MGKAPPDNYNQNDGRAPIIGTKVNNRKQAPSQPTFSPTHSRTPLNAFEIADHHPNLSPTFLTATTNKPIAVTIATIGMGR